MASRQTWKPLTLALALTLTLTTRTLAPALALALVLTATVTYQDVIYSGDARGAEKAQASRVATVATKLLSGTASLESIEKCAGELLIHGNKWVRAGTCEQMRHFKKESLEAHIPALIAMQADMEWYVRQAAGATLEVITIT